MSVGDYVYVLGGFGGSQRFNDIWKSQNLGMFLIYMKHIHDSFHENELSFSTMDLSV